MLVVGLVAAVALVHLAITDLAMLVLTAIVVLATIPCWAWLGLPLTQP